MSKFDTMDRTDIETQIERDIASQAFETQAPRMQDFAPEPYDHEEVIEDMDKCDAQEAKWSGKINPDEAEQLEKLIGYSISVLGILGESAKAYPTARYDDYFNHVDAIAEVGQEDGETLRFAIDATQEPNPAYLQRKFDYSNHTVQRGELNEVKYFAGDGTESKQRREMVRLVIPAPRKFAIWDNYISIQRDLAIATSEKGNPAWAQELYAKQDEIEEQIRDLFLGQLYKHLEEQCKLAPDGSPAARELAKLKDYFEGLESIKNLKEKGVL